MAWYCATVLQAALLDLDGTLTDTPGQICATAEQVLRELGLQPIPASAVRATIGLPLEVAFAGLLDLPRDERVVQEAVERYRRVWRETVIPRGPALLYPGVREGLAALRAAGIRLAVATGKSQLGAESTLQACGLSPLLELIVGFDHPEVAHPKPHPQMAQLICAKLGVAPDAAAMVGDTSFDMLMARGAGLRAVGVTYGAHEEEALREAGATVLAQDFAQAVTCLQEYASQ